MKNLDEIRARPKRERPSPWEKIMRAWERGTGLYLDFDEVQMLRFDNAIETVAEQDRDERLERQKQRRALPRGPRETETTK